MIDRRKFLAGTGMVAAGAISRRLYAQAGPPRRGADEASPWIWEARQVLCHIIGKRRSGPIVGRGFA